jgi:hypothetical protein
MKVYRGDRMPRADYFLNVPAQRRAVMASIRGKDTRPEKTRAGSNPAFGTIAILKGNLASRQVPFFRENGPSG